MATLISRNCDTPPNDFPSHSTFRMRIYDQTTEKIPGGVGSALRVGLLALRGVRAEEELLAPYVALGQPVEQRRRELSSRFGTALSPHLCRCPRCLLEAGGARSCGGDMLKVINIGIEADCGLRT